MRLIPTLNMLMYFKIDSGITNLTNTNRDTNEFVSISTNVTDIK